MKKNMIPIMKLEDNELVNELSKLEILKTQNLIDKNYRHERYSNVDTLEINSKNLTTLLSSKKYDENESAILFHDLTKLTFNISLDGLKIQYSDFENIIHCLIGREKRLSHLWLKLKYAKNTIYHVSIDQCFQFFEQITQSMSKTTSLSIDFSPNYYNSIYYQSLLPSQNRPSQQRSLIYHSNHYFYSDIIKPSFQVFKNLTRLEFPFDMINDDSYYDYIFQQQYLQTLILWYFRENTFTTDKIEKQLNNLLLQLSRVDFYLGNTTSDKIIFALNQIQNEILQKSNLTDLQFIIKNSLGYRYLSLQSVDFRFLSNLRKLKKLAINSCYVKIINIGEALSNNNQQQQLTVLKLNVNMDQPSLDQLAYSLNKLTKLRLLMVSFINNQKSELNLGVLFQQISNLVDLENLSVTVNEFCKHEENDLEYLGSSLKLLKNLNKFSLVILNKQVNDIQFVKLTERIKELINLKKLRLEFLEQNCFGDEGLSSLAECLGHLQKLKRLQLILNSENISRKGTLNLQQSIQILKTHQLSFILLEISDYETYILQTLKQTDQALEPLKKTIKLIQVSLDKFSMPYYYNYQYPFYKSKDQIKTLEMYQDAVTSINLLIPNLIGDKNYQGVINGLNILQNLCDLYLEIGRIDKNGIIAITSFIQTKQPQLKELSLHISSYKEKEDVKILFEGLKKMNKLDYLSLFVNQDYQDTIQDNNFFENLKSLKRLKLIFIGESILRFESIAVLESLSCLWLIYKHQFSIDEFDHFKNQLNVLQKFQYLSLCVQLNSKNPQMITEEQRFPLNLNRCENLTNLIYLYKDYNNFSQNQKMELYKYKRLVTFQKCMV